MSGGSSFFHFGTAPQIGSDSVEIEAQDLQPMWGEDRLKEGNEAALMEWTRDAYEKLSQATTLRANTQIRNMAAYFSIHFRNQNIRADFRTQNASDLDIDSHKIVFNEFFEIVKQRVNKITKNKPTTAPVPRTNDYASKVGARVAKQVLDTLKDQIGQTRLLREAVRQAMIFGESYLWFGWDPDRGDVHPRWTEEVAKLKKNEDRKTIEIDGEKIVIDRDDPIRIGDFDIQTIEPWDLLFEAEKRPQDVEYVIRVRNEHVDKVRADYPDLAAKINPTQDAHRFTTHLLQVESLQQHVRIYDVWHRSNKYVPNGAHFVMTDEVMLEDPKANPFSRLEESQWGNLPIEMMVDIEVDGSVHGVSTFQIIANLQRARNQFGTMINHYLLLAGHPKYMVPRQSKVNWRDLGNDGTIVEFSGTLAPQLVKNEPISSQVFQFWDMLGKKILSQGDITGVNQGELPPGVKAAKAIQLLEELENLRATDVFNRYNELVVAFDRKLLSFAADKFEEEDGRMINYLGDDKKWLVDDFDAGIFNRSYDVKLQLSSALPQTPSARMQVLLDFFQVTGGKILPMEQWIDLFDLKSEQKFVDLVTNALQVAEWENEQLIQGFTIADPRPEEDVFTHWRSHASFVQSRAFLELPDSQREKALDHLKATEWLMHEKAGQNPRAAEELLSLSRFPLVFEMLPDRDKMVDTPGGTPIIPEGAQSGQPLTGEGQGVPSQPSQNGKPPDDRPISVDQPL